MTSALFQYFCSFIVNFAEPSLTVSCCCECDATYRFNSTAACCTGAIPKGWASIVLAVRQKLPPQHGPLGGGCIRQIPQKSQFQPRRILLGRRRGGNLNQISSRPSGGGAVHLPFCILLWNEGRSSSWIIGGSSLACQISPEIHLILPIRPSIHPLPLSLERGGNKIIHDNAQHWKYIYMKKKQLCITCSAGFSPEKQKTIKEIQCI